MGLLLSFSLLLGFTAKIGSTQLGAEGTDAALPPAIAASTCSLILLRIATEGVDGAEDSKSSHRTYPFTRNSLARLSHLA